MAPVDPSSPTPSTHGTTGSATGGTPRKRLASSTADPRLDSAASGTVERGGGRARAKPRRPVAARDKDPLAGLAALDDLPTSGSLVIPPVLPPIVPAAPATEDATGSVPPTRAHPRATSAIDSAAPSPSTALLEPVEAGGPATAPMTFPAVEATQAMPLATQVIPASTPTPTTVAVPEMVVERPLRQPVVWRRTRPRIRRVTRVVRHVDTWSVFKVAFVFNLVVYLVCLTSGVLLWNVAHTTGTVDNVEKFFEQFGWSSFEFKGGELFHNAWIAGLFVSIGLTGFAVLLATLFNLITDLVGGIRVSVLEEEVIARGPKGAVTRPGDAHLQGLERLE